MDYKTQFQSLAERFQTFVADAKQPTLNQAWYVRWAAAIDDAAELIRQAFHDDCVSLKGLPAYVAWIEGGNRPDGLSPTVAPKSANLFGFVVSACSVGSFRLFDAHLAAPEEFRPEYQQQLLIETIQRQVEAMAQLAKLCGTSTGNTSSITCEMAGTVAGVSKATAGRKFNNGRGGIDANKVVFAAYQQQLAAEQEKSRDAIASKTIAKQKAPRVGQLCKCLKPDCDWTGDATANMQCPEGHRQGIEPITRQRK